jgi:hypothetical protein
MAIPWLQIVKYVPTIVTISKELLQQTRASHPSNPRTIEGRLVQLEENERKQAELVQKMAHQIAALTEATIAMRRQFWVILIVVLLSAMAALSAIFLVMSRS